MGPRWVQKVAMLAPFTHWVVQNVHGWVKQAFLRPYKGLVRCILGNTGLDFLGFQGSQKASSLALDWSHAHGVSMACPAKDTLGRLRASAKMICRTGDCANRRLSFPFPPLTPGRKSVCSQDMNRMKQPNKTPRTPRSLDCAKWTTLVLAFRRFRAPRFRDKRLGSVLLARNFNSTGPTKESQRTPSKRLP